MGTYPGQQRPFPAVAIVFILFLVCLFLSQFWVIRLLPGISRLIWIHPSLTLLDIPIDLPVTLYPIPVLGLFLFIYPVLILVYPSRPWGMSSGEEVVRRLGAFVGGSLIFLLCIMTGGIITYLAGDHLSKDIHRGVDSFGLNADMGFPYPGYETVHLRGNVFSLLGFIIGIAILIWKIRRPLGSKKRVRLTREQRMSPYERMIEERKQGKQEVSAGSGGSRLRTPCRNEPVMRIEPEAVNYMPMG